MELENRQRLAEEAKRAEEELLAKKAEQVNRLESALLTKVVRIDLMK